MKKHARWMLALSLSLSLGACKKDKTDSEEGGEAAESPKKNTGKAAAKKSPAKKKAAVQWPPVDIKAPVLEATCQSECQSEGKGDFFERCDCKEKGLKSPLAARPTQETRTTTNIQGEKFEKTLWEVKNRSDRPLHWASVKVYYYDDKGEQIVVTEADDGSGRKPRTFKNASMNGSTFRLAAGETKKIALGFSSKLAPKDAAHIDVVFDGWCFGELDRETSKEKNQLCIKAGGAPAMRPMPPR